MDNKDKLFQEFKPVSSQEWENKVIADLKGADFNRKLVWKTFEGLDFMPYYREEDLENLKYLKSIPGKYPFVRGNKTNGNNWEIRQDLWGTDYEKVNALAIDTIARGAEGIGLNIKKIESYENICTLLEGIDIEKTSIHFISAKNYPRVLAWFVRYIEKNNIDYTKVKGSANFDPISYLAYYKDFYGDEEVSFATAFGLLKEFGGKLPNFKLLNIGGYHYNNAGASIVQELAFVLAQGNDYIYRIIENGADIDTLSNQIQITLGIGSNYFMEIAKIRAARLLWTKIIDQYNPKSEESYKIHIHSTNSLWNKSIYDANVNMLRMTTEAMSASIGGCDSLSLAPYDITYRKPDDLSYRTARNTQIILKSESYFNKISDPSAGSYYLETLTDSIASAAWDLFKEIEEKGGMSKALVSGFIYDQINETCAKRDKAIAERKISILGTNQFPNAEENMIGEIKDTLFHKKEWLGLKPYRGAQEFEKMRLATEKYISEGNKKPVVFLLTIGNVGMRKARAGFASNFYACGGFQIIDNNGFKSAADGVKAAIDKKADIVVICSSDDEYADYGVKAAQMIKDNNKNTIVSIAGNPKDHIEALNNAGVDDYIHVKVNILENLKEIQEKLNIVKA